MGPAGVSEHRPRVEVIDEGSLRPDDRRSSGRLLADEWGSDWRKDGHAGPHPPEFRVLSRDGAGSLTGHVSAFAIPTSPTTLLYGIGDLVVAPAHRRRGVAGLLCAEMVAECDRRAAEVILIDTLAAEAIFLALGFRVVRDFRYFYVRDGACHRHRHWLAAERRPRGRLELLEHGDF